MGVALVVALVTIWASKHYLKDPEELLDWAALVFSGMTAGILAFFVTWGHFQEGAGEEVG
jgi:hypothetical protein